MQAHFIAVDLGGTQIRVALSDANGKISQPLKERVAAANAEAVFVRIVDCINEVAGTESIRGIGLGAPGPLDPWRGIIFASPQSGRHDQLSNERKIGKRVSLAGRCG